MLSQSTIPFQDFKQQQSSIAGSEYIKFPLASVEPEAFGSFRVRNPDSWFLFVFQHYRSVPELLKLA